MNRFYSLLFVVLFSNFSFAQKTHEWKEATSGGYTYKYVTNDPIDARFYTLKNGLTVILSKNEKKPRITSWIAVRTGSNNDPENHTGLAHYLEHMMFKGTQKFGTTNWEKEKPYIDKIYKLYDEYNKIPTSDSLARKEKYHQIDSISGLASKISIANEYDKLMANIGSEGTNAFTSVERTVYVENFPSNALDKYLQVQAERFRDPVFRLFHTELEAVYEEKNRGLDNDNRKVYAKGLANLFPQSHYGTQTTIGTIEHLKNPSLSAIKKYYNEYYVPNNMAIVMAGDLDYDKTIKAIDEDFSYMKPHPVNQYNSGKQPEITKPIVSTVTGPSAEFLAMGYRLGGAGTKEALMAELIDNILNNGKAGLLDLDLNKKQLVQGVSSNFNSFRNNSIFYFYGSPKSGQTLEQVKDLILKEVDKLKKGEFSEKLLKAIIANYKLGELQGQESNEARVGALADEFIFNKGIDWNNSVDKINQLSKITKKEVVDFANKLFKNNYTLIYKRKGENDNKVKVVKPAITPVETNAGKNSAFITHFNKEKLPPIEPKWIDFNKEIQKSKLGNVEILSVENKKNDLFTLSYKFDIGSYNNKLLSLALQYLYFLGTDKYSSADISTQFYDMACSFGASASGESMSISVSGLDENREKATVLLEDLVRNCKPNQTALEALKNRIRKARKNAKLSKGSISSALRSYALYGKDNPFNYTLSDKELNDLKAEQLVAILHNIFNYKHRILYYGKTPLNTFKTQIAALHKLPKTFAVIPNKKVFKKLPTNKTRVLFANYDMVQAEIFWNRTLDDYTPEKDLLSSVFNGYFGGGMGTVVFQTIRESKALAYSTYAFVSSPSKKDEPFVYTGYVGTQADKFTEAVNAMNELVQTLPKNQSNYENTISSIKKSFETERITGYSILSYYLNLKKKGIDYDIRKKWYNEVNNISLDDLINYHNNELTGKPYVYTIVASKDKLPMEKMKKLGPVKELTLTELFGY